MSKDQEREAFEHYFSDGGKSPRSVERGADGKYLLGSAHNAWRVWQASRAAMAPAGEPTNDERNLRRLLAVRSAMPHTYFDDGEAQGQEHGIVIDFMREKVPDIDAKLRALNVARAECAAAGEPTDRAEVLRLADEMALRSYEEAQCACYTEEEAKSRNSQSSARAALVRLLGGE